ncbi:MAG: two-component system response regulator [Clostridia bacterium]
MTQAKVLLVDDDEAVLDFMKAKLGTKYQLVATTSASSVLALAREHRPDVIVCDVDMPGMDGGDVSAALYGDDGMRDIPLIFLTGLLSAQELQQKGGQLGGRPALSKNAPVGDLIERIDSLLKR